MKRLVLHEPSGIWRIVGAAEGSAFPEAILWDGVQFTPVKVEPRYILYKFILLPESGRFGEFHPAQR